MKIINIKWETDGLEQESLGLPYEVELPSNIDPKDDDAIDDYLSNTYGWLALDWCKKYRYEVYDCNDEVIDAHEDLQMAQIAAEVDNAKFIYDTNKGEVVWGEY